MLITQNCLRSCTICVRKQYRTKVCFLFERIFNPKLIAEQPIFVFGLARSGTTFLMTALERDKKLGTLLYNDMPLVLSPNLNSFLQRKQKNLQVAKERSHGDGVMISQDSPEALEEPFWRSMEASCFICKDTLNLYDPSDATMDFFESYIGLILRARKADRYISKNNNNILRWRQLTKFPHCYLICMFRHPLEQAISLARMHDHFCEAQKKDPFTRSYMGFLSHYEFGLDRKSFVFDGDQEAIIEENNVSFYLQIWIRCYQYLLSRKDLSLIFVSYEDLCADEEIWSKIYNILGLDFHSIPDIFNKNIKSVDKTLHKDLLSKAELLYNELNLVKLK